MNILLLAVDENVYGIDQRCVLRVIDPRREPVHEDLNEHRASYRGEQLRLVDVRRDLEQVPGTREEGQAPAYLLVKSKDDGDSGRYLLSVDEARAIISVSGNEVFPIPPYVFEEMTDCFRGVFEYQGRLQLLFNEQRL
ncbi:MAG: chemotaxis protein CheW [Acidobacteria bacterium]|nr:chemotaxis protein CheW [Acidobacteriota bacterium]